MQLYLPIAEVAVNPLIIVMMGGAVGFLSGMFGVGGGFLMTPLLIFYGIPPAVAVGTEASQILASSVSGVMAQTRRKAVDFRMGYLLVAGGAAGSVAGVMLFRALMEQGQIDLFISLAYVLFLGVIGALMMVESLRALTRPAGARPTKRHRHSWTALLPLRMRFRRSQLYISVLPPLALGVAGGLLAAVMGVGGGFFIVPAMIYILNMPTNVVVGTSLFQIAFVTAITTVLHAAANQTVDILLALLLLFGGVIGAQLGVRVGARLKAEQLRALLALIVLAVCARMAWGLIATPASLFVVEGGH